MAGTPHGQILKYLSTAEIASGEPHSLGHPDQWWRMASL